MSNKPWTRPGIIVFVCRSCGAKLYEYRLGAGPARFSGVPIPNRALMGYMGVCPVCKRWLELPGRHRTMDVSVFEECWEEVDGRLVDSCAGGDGS